MKIVQSLKKMKSYYCFMFTIFDINRNKNYRKLNFETIDNYNFKNIINEEIIRLYEDLKNNEFFSLCSIRPDYIDNIFIDLTDENIKQNLIEKILENKNNPNDNEINIYESSRNIKLEDFEEFIEKLSLAANEQEKNNLYNLIERLDEFNQIFDEEIEKAMQNSVFEYKNINIILIEKDCSQFNESKNNCANRKDKLLFHGTKASSAIGIVSSQFNHAKEAHQIGKGVYMTDSLDYMWYYAFEGEKVGKEKYCNINKIPSVGFPFNFVASQIFYDSDKFEYVYNTNKSKMEVENNGIRCAYDNSITKVLSETEVRNINNYNRFYGKEFVISNFDQILPLYVVTVKRVEYLVIWRDYNFNSNNINNYPPNIFQKIQNFHNDLKHFITRNLNAKIYYIENSDEALKLIDRKKYNKIIIITNGANDA